MDLFIEDEHLKVSALGKAKYINSSVHNVTIGPNRTDVAESKRVSKKTVKNEEYDTIETVYDGDVEPSTTNNIVSINKMLQMEEYQRQIDVQNNIRLRLNKIKAFSDEINADLRNLSHQRQQFYINQDREQEEFIVRTLAEFEQNNERQLQLQYKKQEERSKRNQEIHLKEKQIEAIELLTVQKHYHAFRLIYQEILSIIKSCNRQQLSSSLFTSNCAKLKGLTESIEKVREKCKNKTLTKEESKSVFTLVQGISDIRDVLLKGITEDKRPEVKTVETPPKTVEIEKPVQKLIQPQKPAVQPVQPVQNKEAAVLKCDFASKLSLQLWSELQQFLETYQSSFKLFTEDPRVKQLKFNLQKAVNIPLNAISSLNSKHILDKYQKLSGLLNGDVVEAGGSTVSVTQHPQALEFSTNLLAKKFVAQGDLMVSSNPESAHCFSIVLVALWMNFPDFGKLVLAHFYQEAPYLVPVYPPQLSGHSDQDYYRSLGYKYPEGVIEKQDKFLKRMSGIVRLYAAITIAKPKGSQENHPHGLRCAWRWLSSILNLEPRMDITATLLYHFLDVTGSTLQLVYGKQFQKLLNYLCDVFLVKLQQIDSGGPVTRLEVLLQKVKKNGCFETPKGKLPDGFI